VEIGAFDGLRWSNALLLEHCYAWSGLLIEANPKSFVQLRRSGRQRSIYRHLAVCAEGVGSVQMSADGDSVAGQVGMMPAAHVKKWTQRGFLTNQTVAVPCAPLGALMRGAGLAHGATFLSPDVEGAEEEVPRCGKFCKIGPGGGKALGQGLKHNTVLTKLVPKFNQIKDLGGIAIGDALKTNETLKELDLRYCEIGREGDEALGQGLKGNTVLTKLNLSHNLILDVGAIAIYEVLWTNETLEELDLRICKIGQVGGVALAEGLKGNTVLTKLHLSDNPIKDLGGIAIGEALGTNKTLKELDLEFCGIGQEGCKVLDEGLKGNTALTNLQLSFNACGAPPVQAAVQKLHSPLR